MKNEVPSNKTKAPSDKLKCSRAGVQAPGDLQKCSTGKAKTVLQNPEIYHKHVLSLK